MNNLCYAAMTKNETVRKFTKVVPTIYSDAGKTEKEKALKTLILTYVSYKISNKK